MRASPAIARRTAPQRPPMREAAWLCLIIPAAALAAFAAHPAQPRHDEPPAPSAIRYGRDVRPILSDRCFFCHGADEAARKAGLRLDSRDSALAERKGRPAIVPGNPDESELWQRITSHDPDEVMPPPSANKRPLSDDEKRTIRLWIEQGAPYEPHWSFVPPVRHPPPTVADDAWPRDDIDRHILAALESRELRPSPEADRATLLRRLHLDLTGLPPTPDELDSFLADPAPDAYERRVDSIFAAEPYRSRLAERLAAPWLDAARYADTIGIHTDNGRQTWLWRDWVLAAFRNNMPYDRFLTEQLAGDLLPDATPAQKIATGFNRNHVITDEGGAIPDEYLIEYAVDRANTTGSVFLGLTLGCARCHDHKYDPISQADFYSLLAFFNSIEEPGLYSQTADANRAYEPFLDVPTPGQSRELDEISGHIRSLTERLERPIPGEEDERAAFLAETTEAAGVRWTLPRIIAAASTDASVKLTPQEDHSILATGPMPDTEDYIFTLRTGERSQRLILIEALPTPGAKSRGAGRADHGNVVITGITAESRPTPPSPLTPADPASPEPAWRPISFRWAWANHTQTNRDYEPGNMIDADDATGWAADGNAKAGGRLLALLTDAPFGAAAEDEPADVRITIRFRSQYTRHSLGRVRFRFSPISETGLPRIPVALGRWYAAGPFRADDAASAYDTRFGPETIPSLDLKKNFGAGNLYWTFSPSLADERNAMLADGLGAHYVGRTIHSPDTRTLRISLGTDDGFQLFLNGEQVAERRVDRGLTPGQDEAALPLKPGLNTLVLKVVNTGGPSGYHFRPVHGDEALTGLLFCAALPADALNDEQSRAFAVAWRRRFSGDYRTAQDDLAAANRRRDAVLAAVPRTMVMKELAAPRPTFVLTRGLYDQPDRSRPVSRAIPAAFGALPADAPANRLGLAQWMTTDDNPLVARVAVNRVWEMLFGAGLVRTSEDFGLQGEWPSHPELLDTLAVDFRASGWDTHALLKRIVLSSTYRQSSRIRPDAAAIDPDNRLLSRYPRRRLSAEQLRDQALFISGLLAEKLGGPSVKPYQPEGLWQEVAMLVSNTREYAPGRGSDLYRRGIYTYWKRAVPPPALQILDAPTREACTIRRLTTNTPLQALALWNDTQFLEAARILAQRTLADAEGDNDRLSLAFRRCTGRTPDAQELSMLAEALAGFRTRFASDPSAAAEFLRVGESPLPADADSAELAAWTLIASGLLNLHEAVTQD